MDPFNLEQLAPGVRGYTMTSEDGSVYVPVVVAMNPGHGDVGRYIDSLPKDKTVKFPTVISARLEGMLKRRGFTLTREWDPNFEEWAEVYVREKS